MIDEEVREEIVKLVRDHQRRCPFLELFNVARQEQENIHKGLEGLREWRKSLWSNGSGGPPGYLELFVKDTDKQFTLLKDMVQDLHDKRTRQEGAEERNVRSNTARRTWLVAVLSLLGGVWGARMIELMVAVLRHKP